MTLGLLQRTSVLGKENIAYKCGSQPQAILSITELKKDSSNVRIHKIIRG